MLNSCFICWFSKVLKTEIRRENIIVLYDTTEKWFIKSNIFKGSRTTPHEDNSPPDKNKAQPLPTRTTIPRTIAHQDNSPLGPLPRNKPLIRTKTCTVGNCPPGELSGYDFQVSDMGEAIIKQDFFFFLKKKERCTQRKGYKEYNAIDYEMQEMKLRPTAYSHSDVISLFWSNVRKEPIWSLFLSF